MSERAIVRTSAPVRLDFAGGWTDVAPFAVEEGGCVINAALEARVHVEIHPGDCHRLQLGHDGEMVELKDGEWCGSHGSEFDLQKAALRDHVIPPSLVRTHSTIPPGSGLGGSGALGVALVAAMDITTGITRRSSELAEMAFMMESQGAKLAGGKQDQYAAALGGFNTLHFKDGGVTVVPVKVDESFARFLEEHLLICYTGTSRTSSATISRVMTAYARGDHGVVGALRRMVSIAGEMQDAIERRDPVRVGRLLTENWIAQRALDEGMQTAEMARLERVMHESTSLGGKAAGSGAGGAMFFLVSNRRVASKAATEAGFAVIPTKWSSIGVKWERG